MHVAHLWRYPVKSMRGEELTTAVVSEDGIAGDRLVQVVSPSGRYITSRTHPKLLLHRATTQDDGQILVDGEPWDSPSVAQRVGARLVRYEGPERFDVLPLLVATDGAIQDFGRDYRRLRPNIVIGGVEGLAEREWEGKSLAIGDCVIAVDSLRMRCVMTTYDPDTAEQDISVLRDIVRRYDGEIALNCDVARGGTIRVGDPVELRETAG
jgi:uncharacterized protein